MPDRLFAEINPAALAWAREVRGMPVDVAASRIGVTPERLTQFEGGVSRPTISQLRNIGRVYRKPTAFFYRTALPAEPEPPTDFRRSRASSTDLSPELRDAITRARERRADASELAESLSQAIQTFSLRASVGSDPERLASRIRERLGVTLAEQLKLREQYVAL